MAKIREPVEGDVVVLSSRVCDMDVNADDGGDGGDDDKSLAYDDFSMKVLRDSTRKEGTHNKLRYAGTIQ